MALKWRASGAALGQNSIGDWARSLHSSDRCAYSIMHAGLSPDADRRLNCLRSCTPDRPGVKTFHCLTRPKASSQRLEFFWKKPPWPYTDGWEPQRNPTKGSAAKLPTLPAPF